MADHDTHDHTGIPGVGGSLTVQDEGSPLTTAATTLNFVGSGVAASGSGATKTITIAGGSGGSPFKRATSTAAGSNQGLTTSFAALFSTQFSLSLAAAVNDIMKMELTITHTDSNGQNIIVDFAVNGTRIGDATNGSFTHFMVDNAVDTYTIVAWRTVVSGDLSGGNFPAVPHVKSDVNTVPTILYNTPPAVFVLTNLGPVTP